MPVVITRRPRLSNIAADLNAVNGIVRGNGSGAFAAATAGTDYVAPGGALGTPTSGVATNLTGTASGLIAGNVTTNANLTGVITSSGNATSVGATFLPVRDFSLALPPPHSSPSSTLLMISDTAYWIYLGKCVVPFTITFIRAHCVIAGTVSSVGEFAVATRSTPLDATSPSLTKVAAASDITSTLATGFITHTTPLAAAITAGQHVYIGSRMASGGTQPTFRGAIEGSLGFGAALSTLTAGALTGAGPWTGVPIAAGTAIAMPYLTAVITIP